MATIIASNKLKRVSLLLVKAYSKNILEKIKRSKVDGLFYIIQIITV